MTVKLIAVDMDGTFLDTEGDYNRVRFASQYAELQRRGIKFVVASGNQYYQLKTFFDAIDPDIAYVAENGAYVVDKQQEIYCAHMAAAQTAQVLAFISDVDDIEITVCGKNGAYMLEKFGDSFFNKMKRYYFRLQRVTSYADISEPIFKFAIEVPHGKLAGLMTQVEEHLGGIVKPVSSGHGSVDLVIPGNHKANGLKKIQQLYSIEDHQVLAFGDGGNDLEMLQHAGFGFAMQNAQPKVLASARYRAGLHHQEGVLQVIDDCLAGRVPFEKR